MNYIIYDLEWDENGKKEIVDIGAVKLQVIDGIPTIIDKYQSFVRPTKHYYTYFCEQFTSISKETIDLAREFPEVLDEFIAWIGPEEHAFCIWGNGDRIVFHRNCDMHKINIENWMSANNDIQIQVSKLLGLEKHQRVSLKNAIKAIGIEHDGDSYHRADFDAEGTAKVMIHFFDKLQLFPNVKGKKSLRRQKGETNIESFISNDRKQMAAWMEGRLEPILNKVTPPIKDEILKDVTRWEDAKEILKYECLKIYNNEETQEMSKKNVGEFFKWVKQAHPENFSILMALNNGMDSNNDFIWKKQLFLRTFHIKNQKVS